MYLDTSALIKLYVVEEGRRTVERAVAESETVIASAVAYPEARSALARRTREGALSGDQHSEAVRALDDDWPTLERITASNRLALMAGDLAERHALRGLDAIHLASAMLANEATLEDAAPGVSFLTFDSALRRAAGRVLALYRGPRST